MLFRSITLQEANLFLPLLKEHFSKIQVLVAKGQALHEKILNGSSQVDTSGGIEFSEEKTELEEIEYKIREQMIELQQYGAIVKSVFPARVDFRSERHKQPVYLCWQSGDDQVSHWHPVEEGFMTRRFIQKPEEFGTPVVH
jgi:hypothetical protein